ncbi:hypothetical protein OG195_27385 [Streptomyces sp. NBC_01362]|uniref:hypothetical protein n=1 Tax=Streptomyces sp. NBC_01362 TaxID=2903839 RepID=UPI002E2F3253|nr:hypothetical protein [Streptomyces sp. NBC_01362]
MSERHTVGTITADALAALYEQLEAAQQTELARQLTTCDKAFASATVRAAQYADRAIENGKRAEQAEAGIARVRAELHALASEVRGISPIALAGRRDAVARIRAALDKQPTT